MLLSRAYAPSEIDSVKASLGQTKDLASSPKVMLPEILRLRQEGKSLSEIGRRPGFTHQTVGRVLQKRLTEGQFED